MSPTNSNNPATKASDSASASGDADLAQAYRDLARGEHAATALENNLSNLESRLDAILAALEAKEDPQLPVTAIASKPEDSSKVEGTDDSKDEPQDGTTGDAVKAGKGTA